MKNKSKLSRYGGVIFILLFVIFLFIMNTGIMVPKYERNLDTTSFPVVYSKDNILHIAPLDKKTSALSDPLTVSASTHPEVRISNNGNAVYFFENYDGISQSGSLFATYDGKEKISVSAKAYKKIFISDDGKFMLYAENPDSETGRGKLILWEKGGKKTEICDKASLSGFNMDTKKGTVFYVEGADGSDSGDLYVMHGKTEKIDSGVFTIAAVTDSSSVVYTKRQDEGAQALYYWNSKGEALKLSDDMLDFRKSTIDTSSFVWCGEGGALMSYKNKTTSTLDTNASNILKSDASRRSVLYTKNLSPETYEYDVNLVFEGCASEKIASSSGNMLSVKTSYDFKKTAYIENNNLYIKEKGWHAKKEPILVAENVESFELSPSGLSIAYVKDGTLYLEYNKKVSAVSDNVETYRFTPNGSGLCYLANYNETKRSGNLFVRNALKPSAESVKIDSDVMYSFHARSEKSFVYIRNYNNETGEGELCISRNGKIHTIDSGRIKVLCEKY